MWEHRIETKSWNFQKEDLDKASKEGWELVSVVYCYYEEYSEAARWHAFFRRKIG